MAMMFGRFEVQSEISKSETCSILKALDHKTNEVVALKTQDLSPLGDRVKPYVASLMAEGDRTRELASQNIALLYGAGEVEGKFCAAMEYIQGNSVATTLQRGETFSIWDILDISRQMAAALEHAAALGVVHTSLEPAKIMVQWEGLVKVLGYGISNMSLIRAESGLGLGSLMPYCSPEQLVGDTIDSRSNLFTLGAILYEMAAGRKAFAAEDQLALLNQIQHDVPPEPITLNAKVHPGVSAAIMKALAKDPGARYATARALMDDLEECKDGSKKVSAKPEKVAFSVAPKIDPQARAAAAAKFTTPIVGAAATKPAVPNSLSRGASNLPVPAPPLPAKPTFEQPPRSFAKPAVKSAAAAAGAVSHATVSSTAGLPHSNAAEPPMEPSSAPAWRRVDSENDTFDATSSYDAETRSEHAEQTERHAPRFAVDPVMAGAATSAPKLNFSDVTELPPLKEPVFVDPLETGETLEEEPPPFVPQSKARDEEKSRVERKIASKFEPKSEPRKIAQKAVHEVATIPPRLILFSVAGAVAVILVVAIAVYVHVHSEDDASTAAPHPIAAASAEQSSPTPAAEIAKPQSSDPQAGTTQLAITQSGATDPGSTQPKITVRPVERRHATVRPPAPAPQPAALTGLALVDSMPQGAAFQLDGKNDPSWVTPFVLAGLSPGKHIVTISKNGYTPEMRSVDVVANAKSSLTVNLAPINALIVVTSTPAGAAITLDGKVTGRTTPAQFTVQKGNHTVLLRKQGFLDETTSTELAPGQNFQYGPALKALGNTDDVRSVGKLDRLFAPARGNMAATGAIVVRTQPKGAQVAVNQRVLDKLSPTTLVMDPGNYVVDITLTGFKPIHKVIEVQKGDRIAINETLSPE